MWLSHNTSNWEGSTKRSTEWSNYIQSIVQLCQSLTLKPNLGPNRKTKMTLQNNYLTLFGKRPDFLRFLLWRLPLSIVHKLKWKTFEILAWPKSCSKSSKLNTFDHGCIKFTGPLFFAQPLKRGKKPSKRLKRARFLAQMSEGSEFLPGGWDAETWIFFSRAFDPGLVLIITGHDPSIYSVSCLSSAEFPLWPKFLLPLTWPRNTFLKIWDSWSKKKNKGHQNFFQNQEKQKSLKKIRNSSRNEMLRGTLL